jgi:hypothetical protein
MAFSFKNDWRAIRWGATLQVLLVRSIAAGIVWGIVIICTGNNPRNPPGVVMPLLFPLIFMPFLLCSVIFGKIVSTIFGVIGFEVIGQLMFGFFSLVAMFGIIVGDPLVFMLHRNAPKAVPVEKFNFLNFMALMFVLDPAKSLPRNS